MQQLYNVALLACFYSMFCMSQAKVAVPEAHFLTPSEEETLVRYYMKKLLELCTQFHPPVPRSTIVSVALVDAQ